MEASKLAVSVVLPTYNEALSLPVIIPRIVEALRGAGIDGEVIVVDDNSPDGTADVARQLAEQFPVRVNKRVDERGLATAVLAGFAMSEAPVCVVMDADGSHPVEALPGMVTMILQDKADVVVGSRHVEGGGSKEWPVFSQLKSKLAATLAFGVTSMSDPTTGFMALRRTLLSKLKLDPVGWKIVLEIVVKAAPVRVAEVPIIFTDRVIGESKQSLRVFAEYLAHLGKLYTHRYPSLAELVKFCVVGLIGLVVDMSTVIALKELFSLDTRLCAVFGFSVAVTTNFLLNRRYTFAQARQLPLLFSYVTYVGTNLAGLALRMLAIELFIALGGVDAGRGYLLSNLVGIALATLLNFVGAKFFAFDPARVTTKSDTESDDSSIPAPMPRASLIPRSALVVLLGAAIYAFASSVMHAELRGSDEGVNVTMAENMRQDARFAVRPSVFPGGRSDWLREDLPALGNLPFYPLLLSLTPQAWGLSGMALLSFIALLCTVLFTSKLAALADDRAGLFTALLLAGSPAVLDAFDHIGFEPVLTAFCTAGLYAFVAGALRKQRALCFLGGAALGLGFLTKMWLIVPYVFALVAFCGVEAATVRRTSTSAGLRRNVAAAAVGFTITATCHLVFIAIAAPDDLPRWISSVYLGIFSGEGVTAGKLSGAAGYATHARSAFYYPLVLYRDHFFLAPIVLFGVGETLRRMETKTTRLLALIAGALIALVALSVPAVKTPAYVLGVVPFLYALAGLCLASLTRAPKMSHPANVALVRFAMIFAALSVVSVLLARITPYRTEITPTYAVAHLVGMACVAALGEAWLRNKPITPVLALFALASLGICAAARPFVAPRTPYAEVAAVLKPRLASSAPGYPSFAAREHGLLQGYLGRAGMGLRELQRDPTLAERRPDITAFVLTSDDARAPESRALLSWLANHTVELTAQIDGGTRRASGFRVFAR